MITSNNLKIKLSCKVILTFATVNQNCKFYLKTVFQSIIYIQPVKNMHGSSLKKSSSTKGVNKGGGAIAPSPNFRKLLTPLSTIKSLKPLRNKKGLTFVGPDAQKQTGQLVDQETDQKYLDIPIKSRIFGIPPFVLLIFLPLLKMLKQIIRPMCNF